MRPKESVGGRGNRFFFERVLLFANTLALTQGARLAGWKSEWLANS